MGLARGLIGPWSHTFPQDGIPGPAIGYLQECLLWWDHWLKGLDTGVMDEPMLRVWMQDRVAPGGLHRERPGRWVWEEAWPPPDAVPAELVVAPGGELLSDASRATTRRRWFTAVR